MSLPIRRGPKKVLSEQMKTAADPSKVAVKAWMKKNAPTFEDKKTGEIDATGLAEAAAEEFDEKDIGGWLDDETHWVWDLAAEVAEAAEKTGKTAAFAPGDRAIDTRVLREASRSRSSLSAGIAISRP